MSIKTGWPPRVWLSHCGMSHHCGTALLVPKLSHFQLVFKPRRTPLLPGWLHREAGRTLTLVRPLLSLKSPIDLGLVEKQVLDVNPTCSDISDWLVGIQKDPFLPFIQRFKEGPSGIVFLLVEVLSDFACVNTFVPSGRRF
jgi:hypothetical protein